MYNIKGTKAEKIEPVTFYELNMLESDLEEIIESGIEMLCDDEESMLVVGRQVKNSKNGRSDLTAVNNNGNIVLIEIKRDPKDIENRKEAFEFQAIRYAASYATIESVEELVKKVYAPYIENNKSKFELNGLTSYELGFRKISDFLKATDSLNSFNKEQSIILAASDYDEQTLSAVAWLNSNNVDISCFKLTPFKINGEIYINAEKILPVPQYNEYYVDLLDKSSPASTTKNKSITRRVLPKIDALLDWGVVKAGDVIAAKGKGNESILMANGNVNVNGIEQSMQVWLKELYGWSSIQTFVFAIHKNSGKSLFQIREEEMERRALSSGNEYSS